MGIVLCGNPHPQPQTQHFVFILPLVRGVLYAACACVRFFYGETCGMCVGVHGKRSRKAVLDSSAVLITRTEGYP